MSAPRPTCSICGSHLIGTSATICPICKEFDPPRERKPSLDEMKRAREELGHPIYRVSSFIRSRGYAARWLSRIGQGFAAILWGAVAAYVMYVFVMYGLKGQITTIPNRFGPASVVAPWFGALSRLVFSLECAFLASYCAVSCWRGSKPDWQVRTKGERWAARVKDARRRHVCPMCGYELAGLPAEVLCPECGFLCRPGSPQRTTLREELALAKMSRAVKRDGLESGVVLARVQLGCAALVLASWAALWSYELLTKAIAGRFGELPASAIGGFAWLSVMLTLIGIAVLLSGAWFCIWYARRESAPRLNVDDIRAELELEHEREVAGRTCPHCKDKVNGQADEAPCPECGRHRGRDVEQLTIVPED